MTKTGFDQSDPEGDDPVSRLMQLRALADRRAELDREEYFLVLELRERNVSWEAIAAALGVSRQAVHKRFRRRMTGSAR
ncbi:AraC family transcriptional regulator [Gordonia sp. TBRC 11910]|uniref:AraC family transcriptional regulator n=1 Tax=Gordonia asplenii TaxID=2725283 RepID=A0A848KUP2_9ACTN|nr:helix-turn-helix transcriptional regulator [Gordonia asplenii]NMO00203.1 AraC family transcriptional regulator [Gordonia asplenii]